MSTVKFNDLVRSKDKGGKRVFIKRNLFVTKWPRNASRDLCLTAALEPQLRGAQPVSRQEAG